MSLLDALIEDELLATKLAPVKEVFIAIRTDGVTGDGTRDNPFDGSTAQKFDQIVAEHTDANTVVRLGPGLFRTEGADILASNPLVVFTGMRFVGAGMYNTTLRLKAKEPGGPTPTNARNFGVIGSVGLVDNVEISDLTIDCDLGNQPKTPGRNYALMALEAVNVGGTNNVLRRVRVINFGTRTPVTLNGVDQFGTPGTAEGFPFYFGGEGSLIEDCVMEQPFLGTARETTIMAAGGAFRTTVRNNFIDGAFINPRNGFPTRVTALTSVGTSPATITVTTQFPHNVKAGDYIEIKGATPAGYNGRWLVITPSSEDATSRTLSFEIPASLGAATGSITLEQSFQPTLRIIAASWASGFLTVTTADKHWRKAGDWVVITGANTTEVAGLATDFFNGTYRVDAAGLTDTQFRVACAGDGANSPTGELWLDRRTVYWRVKDIDRDADLFLGLWPQKLFQALTMAEETATISTYGGHNLKPGEYFLLFPNFSQASYFNSYFETKSVLDREKLVIDVPLEVDSMTTWEIIHTGNATNFQAISGHGAPGSTIEQNRVLNTTRGPTYKDTWATRDVIIRKNYYYNVVNCCYMTLGANEYYVRTGSIPTGGISATEITIETLTDPNDPYVYEKGFIVRLYKGSQTGPNAYLEITAQVSGTGPYTFKLKKPASHPFAAGDTIFFTLIAQHRRVIVENNLFDIAHQVLPPFGIDFPAPFAISLVSGIPSLQEYLYKEVIIRGNLIRPRDNVPDPHLYRNMTGMRVTNCERLIAEGNIMNLMFDDYARAFAALNTLKIKTFNNQDHSGRIVRVYFITQESPVIVGSFIPDLYDQAENWLLGRF